MKMTEDIKQQFFRILKESGISPRYQPIVSLKDGTIYGYEALSRITLDVCDFNVEEMFTIAKELHKIWELEEICRTKSLENAVNKPKNKKLFINVDANIIHDVEFQNGMTLKKLEEFKLSPEDIIFEITERTAIYDLKTFQESVDHYKTQAYKIAIDDVGSGYSGLNRICAVSPDFVKIDMAIVRDIQKDPIKKSLVSSIVRFCEDSNINLIAEGIETIEELETLISLGVTYGQGYYLKRPECNLSELDNDLRINICQLYEKYHKNAYQPSFFGAVGTISKQRAIVDRTRKGNDILEMMTKDLSLSEVCVVTEDKSVLGVLTRAKMYQQLGGRYGYDLHAQKHVTELMSKDFLVVDMRMSIETVSKMALARTEEALYDSVIVTKDDKYYGIVTIKDLLQTAITIQVKRAVESNPLTGLPGNRIIEEKVKKCIESTKQYAIIYVDIDNFKAYNDAYGFNNGDIMITTLVDCIRKSCETDTFKGHVGGDDFVLITHHYEIRNMCEDIIHNFRASIQNLYSDSDWERGFIVSKNRNGFEENFPIASLSISAITNCNRTFQNIEEFSKAIAKVKKRCKHVEGNCISIDDEFQI